MTEIDPRLTTLARYGVRGADAQAALAIFDARGGLEAAHEALARSFGLYAVRVALILLKES